MTSQISRSFANELTNPCQSHRRSRRRYTRPKVTLPKSIESWRFRLKQVKVPSTTVWKAIQSCRDPNYILLESRDMVCRVYNCKINMSGLGVIKNVGFCLIFETKDPLSPKSFFCIVRTENRTVRLSRKTLDIWDPDLSQPSLEGTNIPVTNGRYLL